MSRLLRDRATTFQSIDDTKENRYDFYYFKRYAKYVQSKFGVKDPLERTSETPRMITEFLKEHCEPPKQLSYSSATAICSSLAHQFSLKYDCLRQKYEVTDDGTTYQGSPTCQTLVSEYMAELRKRKNGQQPPINIVLQSVERVKSIPVKSLINSSPVVWLDAAQLIDSSYYIVYLVAYLFCLTIEEVCSVTQVKVYNSKISLNFRGQTRVCMDTLHHPIQDQTWPTQLDGLLLQHGVPNEALRNGGIKFWIKSKSFRQVVEWAQHEGLSERQIAEIILN